MKYFLSMGFMGLFAAVFLTACGGGSTSSSAPDSNQTLSNPKSSSEDIRIVGAGIKGPLAFADAKIFAVDPSFPDFYDESSPISSAITDQYANIIGLSVPSSIERPFILTVGGNQAIDLNTGQPPVIATLVTVVTADMLARDQPLYATPLTTLVFHMARHAAGEIKDIGTFIQSLNAATSEVSTLFAVNADKEINVFRSPLLINDATDTQPKQEQAVYHRAALEAFSAKVYQLSLSKGDGLRATYFNDTTLSGVTLERIDTTVNFAWGSGSPGDGVNPDGFSVRWMGLIEPEYSEEYTFYSSTDDGVRLWVDEQLIIDHWVGQSETEYSSTISLTAGKKYTVVMEYYEIRGNSTARLSWSSASQPKSIISKDNLYSVSDPALIENLTPDSIIDRLALDLQSDGVIDNSANGTEIGGINPTVMEQAPANLLIPKTSDRIKDIVSVMESERTLIGSAAYPLLQVKNIEFDSDPVPPTDAAVVNPNTDTSIGSEPILPPAILAGGSNIDTSTEDSLSAVLKPKVTLSSSSVDFPSQLIGGISDPVPVSIYNGGTGPLIITNISISDDFIESNNCDNYLPVGANCTVEISFVPTTAKVKHGELKIFGSDTSTPYIVTLNGVGSAGVHYDSSSSPSSPCSTLDSIICVDHDSTPAGHHVTDQDIISWFMANPGGAGIINDRTGGAIDIVADPTGDPARGNVMRIFNSEGAKGFTDGLHGPSSGQWRSWPGKYNELYFAFDVYLEPGRLWSKVMKFPGFVGGEWGNADGTHGFSSRSMLVSSRAYPNKPDGALVAYSYHADKSRSVRWPNQGPEGQSTLEPGQWHTIETYLKLNTPNLKNGQLKMWVDGVKVLERGDKRWRTVDSLKLDGLYFTFGYGGGNESFESPEDQYNYYDNWVLSSHPISH